MEGLGLHIIDSRILHSFRRTLTRRLLLNRRGIYPKISTRIQSGGNQYPMRNSTSETNPERAASVSLSTRPCHNPPNERLNSSNSTETFRRNSKPIAREFFKRKLLACAWP